jgi:hypothetical protein
MVLNEQDKPCDYVSLICFKRLVVFISIVFCGF